MSFPVLNIVSDLKDQLSNSPVVILQAPPGAGKSTVLPLELVDEPWLKDKKIIMLEPRRLAARSVAMRMSAIRNESVGQSIGYRVRFENKTSKQTRIEVVTEGILTRMIQSDNALEEVGLLIFDEFHERSLHADLALALSFQVQQVLRDDLRILIMSATLDSEKLSTLLKAPVISSKGRQYPVEIIYGDHDQQTPLPIRMSRTIKKALREHDGDVLAFLPGAGEIQRTLELLEQEQIPAIVFPLFGDLSFERQQQAILPDPDGNRKIVLATSIAETSLTIEGIKIVIDSGLSRVPKFDPRSGLTRLDTVPVTKDAADQRAGRAGRLSAGVCYRLWSAGFHNALLPTRTPEILEADLAPLLLELAQWGIKDINALNWVTNPPQAAIAQAMDLLTDLGALKDGVISNRGRQMLRLPTHPRIAHMLLEAQADSRTTTLLPLACDVAALLEERDPLSKEAGADLSLRVEVLRKWRSRERVNADRNSLERIEKLSAAWRREFKVEENNAVVADKDVGLLIMAAYPERIARQTEKHGERYKLSNNRMVKLPPNDALSREAWLAIAHLDAGSGEGKIFQAAPLAEEDLVAHAEEKERFFWDNERGMVCNVIEKKIGPLVLNAKSLPVKDDVKSGAVICSMIKEQGLQTLEWGEKLDSWQARVLSLRQWRQDENWPDVSHENLRETIHDWLSPFLTGITKRIDLLRIEPHAVLHSILPYDLQMKLDKLAPDRMEVPSGSFIRLHYKPDGSLPVMEVRLQEVFGWVETPSVNEGRTKILLHLLSPGYKPVQVTQDLKSFWSTTYAEVRKELRTRYPKHSWPEDPWTAEAVRGVKRKS